jgi:flagellar assembly protein FliH
MSDHTKFDFANVFTPGAPHPDDDPNALMDPADVPVYSQNQLDAALADAKNDGMTTATEAAHENADAVANQVLAQIQEHFTRLGTFQDSVVTAIHAEAVELALLVGQKFARSLMSKEPASEVEALVLDILQQHSETGGAPRITIRVHPVIAPDITARIETLKNNVAFVGEVSVLPSEGLGPTDCAVEWADGGAVRDLGQLENEVTEAVQRYLLAIHQAGSVIDENAEDMTQSAGEPTAADGNTQNTIAVDVAPEIIPVVEDAAPRSSVIDEIAAEAIQTATPQDQVS